MAICLEFVPTIYSFVAMYKSFHQWLDNTVYKNASKGLWSERKGEMNNKTGLKQFYFTLSEF